VELPVGATPDYSDRKPVLALGEPTTSASSQ
jgi:hypothetical protein